MRDQFLSEVFTTWGHAKLLQHLDVLDRMQREKYIAPIHVQVCPTEVCESDCPFCSVGRRPYKSLMPFPLLEQCLRDFKKLGVKAIEITGGGNPLLYCDRKNNKNINDVIALAAELECDIGVITNAHDLSVLDRKLYDHIDWIRVSLIKLDEGIEPEDYNFNEFPFERLGFSYIAYDADKGVRTGRDYEGTDVEVFRKMARLVDLHPGIRFVRIAGNAIIQGYNKQTKDKYAEVIRELDKHDKFFIKNIDENDRPFDSSCMIGMLRPFVASSPHGDGTYHVYVCNSHVHNNGQTYNLDFAFCEVSQIVETWEKLNKSFKDNGYPYEVRGNKGTGWAKTCNVCCYHPNNELLHTITMKVPDKNFV